MANPVAAIATVASSALASRSASKATRAQTQAAEQQRALEEQMFNRQVELNEPFRQLGLTNLNQLSALYGEGGEFARAPSLNELQMDPGYGFRFGEGMKALERSAAARGGLLSGSMLKGAQRYGQEMGSQEYQNAFNRAMQQREMRSNAMLSVGGVGPAAVSRLGGAAQQYASGAGQAIGAAGQARASGYLAQGSILRNALAMGSQGYEQYRNEQLQPVTIQSQRRAAPVYTAPLGAYNYQGPRFGGAA